MARDDGFKDFTAAMRMVLKNRHGDESVREIRTKRLEVSGDGDKTLSIFDRPRDVKGTAFLSFTHKDRLRRPVALPPGAKEGKAHIKRQ